MIHDEKGTYDPIPYIEAMKQLLPGVRCMCYVECCLTKEENTLYDMLNQGAVPLIEKANVFFGGAPPECSASRDISQEVPLLSVAPVLKRLCKQYDYSYIKHDNGCFYIQKRTTKGHYILLDIDVGPMFKRVDTFIRYVGAGFDHRIGSKSCCPKDQQDLEDYLLKTFQALALAEKDIFPALDSHYPPTPDWFVPLQQ